jgi:hypothetical protein
MVFFYFHNISHILKQNSGRSSKISAAFGKCNKHHQLDKRDVRILFLFYFFLYSATYVS